MTQESTPPDPSAPTDPPLPGSPAVAPVSAAPPGAVSLSYRGPDGAYIGPAPTPDDKSMGMLCHLLGILTAFIGPLIIWLMKKDQSPFVDDQGKEALNFQIAAAVLIPLCLLGFCFAPVLIVALQITRVVFSIIAAIEANKGVAYRYPLTFRFIK